MITDATGLHEVLLLINKKNLRKKKGKTFWRKKKTTVLVVRYVKEGLKKPTKDHLVA